MCAALDGLKVVVILELIVRAVMGVVDFPAQPCVVGGGVEVFLTETCATV